MGTTMGLVCAIILNVDFSRFEMNFTRTDDERVDLSSITECTDGFNGFFHGYGLKLDDRQDPTFVDIKNEYMSSLSNIIREP